MDVRITQLGDEATVTISGRLDANAAEDLQCELGEIKPEVKELVFELGSLTYIASAGLRVLFATLKAQQANQGTVMLAHPQENVVDVLAATGFAGVFIIQP